MMLEQRVQFTLGACSMMRHRWGLPEALQAFRSFALLLAGDWAAALARGVAARVGSLRWGEGLHPAWAQATADCALQVLQAAWHAVQWTGSGALGAVSKQGLGLLLRGGQLRSGQQAVEVAAHRLDAQEGNFDALR